ncbi:MAG: hypothetical protein Q8N84_03250 [bacterium]|nr:hypothetical protein [bacterium]
MITALFAVPEGTTFTLEKRGGLCKLLAAQTEDGKASMMVSTAQWDSRPRIGKQTGPTRCSTVVWVVATRSLCEMARQKVNKVVRNFLSEHNIVDDVVVFFFTAEAIMCAP